jgi:nucleoid DNA-binding protein
MKKKEVVLKLASALNLPPGRTADHLDQMVEQVITGLRRQGLARVKGLGVVKPASRNGSAGKKNA